jgi:hypothetical protein
MGLCTQKQEFVSSYWLFKLIEGYAVYALQLIRLLRLEAEILKSTAHQT